MPNRPSHPGVPIHYIFNFLLSQHISILNYRYVPVPLHKLSFLKAMAVKDRQMDRDINIEEDAEIDINARTGTDIPPAVGRVSHEDGGFCLL